MENEKNFREYKNVIKRRVSNIFKIKKSFDENKTNFLFGNKINQIKKESIANKSRNEKNKKNLNQVLFHPKINLTLFLSNYRLNIIYLINFLCLYI